jgi:hypothetical protein
LREGKAGFGVWVFERPKPLFLLVVAKIKVSILEVKIVITDGIIYRKVYFINKSERGDIYYGGCINPIVEHISYHLDGNVKHTSEPMAKIPGIWVQVA